MNKERYNQLINDMKYILPDFPGFELMSNENWILSIEVYTKTKLKDFKEAINLLDGVIEIQKHHKKDLNGNNLYLVRFKENLG